ncbi:MAG: DNA repair exonuclease [Clostridia bacterium]|nr:DNA repair exonuclease [Clostridia bacterium]
MKIIHTSDLHLDSRIDTLPPDKSKIRRDEILLTFEKLCEYAEKEKVCAVIIAGDAFDTARVSKKAAERFVAAISRAKNTDFLYLSGNHDVEFLSAYREMLPANFKAFNKGWTKYKYGEVTISGITLDKYNAPFVYDGLKLDENDINIVCMHGQVLGYRSEEAAETVSIPMLKNKNIDYLALGHIHSYSQGKIDERGEYAYSGCLDGRGFDETGVKGFVLLETDGKKLNKTFVPFCSRVFYEKEFSVEKESSFYAFRHKVIDALRDECNERSIIKVIIKGSHGADFIVDKDDLTARLNENFFFGKVYDRSTVVIREEDYALDKSVRGEFVRGVLGSGLSEEEKNAVIVTGLNALKGEL